MTRKSTLEDPQARYLAVDMHRIGGYMVRLDAELFTTLLATQAAWGVQGGLVEIGVHHGRSFFLLAMHRRETEKSLAIDLFADDDMFSGDSRGIGRGRSFRANCKKLGVTLSDDEVLVGSSHEFTPDDIADRVGPVRFFSVDGGHRYDDVDNDLRLAVRTTTDEAVIVIDDFASPHWPEVSFATYDWLRGDGSEWAPFAVTQSKLYACHRRRASAYRDVLTASPTLSARAKAHVPYFDDVVASFDRSVSEKALDRLIRVITRAARSAPRAT